MVIGQEGKVSNANLIEIYMISDGEWAKAGGIVATNYGDVINSNCSGFVSGSFAGGIVALNYGTISNSSFKGDVTVPDYEWSYGTGGLVGRQDGGHVTRCYTTGSVSQNNMPGSYGGLVGYLDGTITDSYSLSIVSGNDRTGGLVGATSMTAVWQIVNCFSAGKVINTEPDAGFNVGGIVGETGSTNYSENCFWDIETSGLITSACGIGKTTADMRQQATFTVWDFVNVWDIEEGVSYPFLRGIGEPPSPPEPPWSFVHITDTHIGANEYARLNLVAVLNKIVKEVKPEFIVNTGDVTDFGCEGTRSEETCSQNFRSYCEAVRIATDTGIQIYNIQGNHDQRVGFPYLLSCLNPLICFWDSYNNPKNLFIGSRADFLPYGDTFLFVALNTGDGNCQGVLNSTDIDFLNGLNKQIPKIILTHHPAVAGPDDRHGISEVCVGEWPVHIDDGQVEFLNYCEDQSNNVRLVLSGHTHTSRVYDRNLLTPTNYPKYVITGSIGKPYEIPYPVYRRISVASPPVVENVVQLTGEDYNYKSAKLYSPGYLHVYDSGGQYTGYDPISGPELGIANSVYFSHYIAKSEESTTVFPHEVLIFDPSDQYLYQIIGTEVGTYKLKIASVSAGEGIYFEATVIPMSIGTKHVYALDWQALSADEEGVILQIDADGDGIFERTVISDEDLTSEEFALQTETVIDFKPDAMNLRNPGKLVTVYIELPEGFEVSNINTSTLKLNETISALSKPITIGDYDEDGIADLMVKFDRQQVIEALDSGTQMITLTGRLSDDRPIAGIDFIRVIDGENVELTEPEVISVVSEEPAADSEKNLPSTDNDLPVVSGEDTYDVKEAIGFILFEADEIIDGFGLDSFNNKESAFQLACVIDDVFSMLDEGMYFESLVLLENDILQRMDGCANISKPDEDDWITSIEGQVLLYPLIKETIELLESLI